MHESGEMYLETMLVLSREKGHFRAIDVSEHMGYSKPSVSRAMSILKRDGYITVDDAGLISLTDSGKLIAENIYDRHTTLTAILTLIGVDKETAAEDACRIEHYISDTTFQAIKKQLRDSNYLNSSSGSRSE